MESSFLMGNRDFPYLWATVVWLLDFPLLLVFWNVTRNAFVLAARGFSPLESRTFAFTTSGRFFPLIVAGLTL